MVIPFMGYLHCVFYFAEKHFNQVSQNFKFFMSVDPLEISA